MIKKKQETRNKHSVADENYYRQMIAEVRDYAIIGLDEDGFIRNWNAGAQAIKGYSAEVIGEHFSIFYTPEDQMKHLPHTLLEEARKSGRAVHEGWRVRKDGSKFWGSIVITALHNEDGHLIGYTKVTRDLSEKKAIEDRLRAYAIELESRNKELEQFTYITSHDLQEPLRKIRTMAEVARKSIGNAKAISERLEKIDAAAERMSVLIRSVVNYTDLSHGTFHQSHVNLNDVMNDVLAMFSEQIRSMNAHVSIGPLPVIKAIHSQIGQLFTHLIENALKFSHKDPVVTVSATTVDRGQLLDSPDLPEGRYHELQFIDNGIGFDPQYGKQIFRIFQRLHSEPKFEGTGIGLALCRKIVENHRGYITARSEPGKGATFFVYLPT